jgi:hypothetical protein
MNKRDWYRAGGLLLALSLLGSAHTLERKQSTTSEASAPVLPSFSEAASTSLVLPSGSDVIGIAKGDFNNDGKLDLAVTQHECGECLMNQPFIDAEYNRAFAATEYFGYLSSLIFRRLPVEDGRNHTVLASRA